MANRTLTHAIVLSVESVKRQVLSPHQPPFLKNTLNLIVVFYEKSRVISPASPGYLLFSGPGRGAC